MMSLKSVVAAFLILVLSLPSASASINWNGPANAAIDNLATFLQGIGFKNAGVRPFGYGWEIEKVDVWANNNNGRRSLRQRED